MKKERRRWGDRKDARLVRDIDGMHFIMPLIFPNRSDNEAFISERIDLTNANAYLEKLNEDNPEFKYTLFHLIVTAIIRTVTLRPYMNRFIANGNLYHRNHVSVAFVVKKQFKDESREGLAVVKGKPETNIFTVYESIRRQVTDCRDGKVDESSNFMDIFVKMPRWLSKSIIKIVTILDKRGKVPSSLIATDPYYATVVLTNLGSIKLKGGYHHLANWGTNSVFVTIGEKKIRPVFAEDSTYKMADTVDLGLTVDERIADGYYYSKTVRLLKKLLENPELLEQSIETPVEY